MPSPLAKSIATVALSGTLRDKLEAGGGGRLRRRRDHGGGSADLRRLARRCAPHLRGAGPGDRHLPAVSRLRGDARAAARPATSIGPNASSMSCRRWAPTSCWCAATRSAAAIDDDARAAADLAEMAERAARRGLRVGYEALSWGRHVNRWGHAWRIVQQAGHPALGLIVDSLPYAEPGRRSVRHRPGAGRQAVLRADGRRTEAVDGRAELEPAFPQFPRPGRSGRDRVHARGAWRPATAGRCRSRCSTTNSVPPRHGSSRVTGCAR